MRLIPPTLLASLLIALPAFAEAPGPRASHAGDIPPEEWSAMADGRTLTYRINGEFWANEHYYPGTNHVTLQINDGSCLQGTWDYQAPLYCFHWDGQGTACFRHARLADGEILVIETQDGQDTPMVQTMSGVSDLPLACASIGTS